MGTEMGAGRCQATRSTILPCDLRLAAPGPLGDIP